MAKEIEVREIDKLILLMLCDIYEKTKAGDRSGGGIEPEFIREAIYSGNLWGLGWKYTGIFGIEEADPATVSEVVDILDMWYFMENAYERLSEPEKAQLAEASKLGNDIRFSGFDGNNESEHIGVARFLINQLERFTHFKDRELNCHYPSIDMHRRMLEVFLPLRKNLGMRDMGYTDLLELVQARVHPSRRDK